VGPLEQATVLTFAGPSDWE